MRLPAAAALLILLAGSACRETKPIAPDTRPPNADRPAADARAEAARGENAAGGFSLVVDEGPRPPAGDHPSSHLRCRGTTQVEDLGDRTLLISPVRARIVKPGQPLDQALDAADGLPAERGESRMFATSPAILMVERQLHAHGPEHPSPRMYRLADTRWSEVGFDFGESPVALPGASGLVIVGWVDDPVRGDPGGVPIGNLTRAWRVTPDGVASVLRGWPAVMTWDERSTARTLWALAAKPRRPGKFLLRRSAEGAAALFPIPGFAACRGDDRMTAGLSTLGDVTDDEAIVTVDPFGCVPDSAAGVYRFHVKSARWVRESHDPSPPPRKSIDDQQVTARNATFKVEGASVLVTRDGVTERFLVGPGPLGGSYGPWLSVTAGGREVWAATTTESTCQLYRFDWADRPGPRSRSPETVSPPADR